MARLGKLPVKLPENVKVEISDSTVKIVGPKGEITRMIPDGIKLKQTEEGIVVEMGKTTKQLIALQGTIRSHLLNMITGVTEGWQKSLEIVGTGYRAEVRGADLVLTVGFSHPVNIKAPDGVKFSVEKSVIKVEGIDKDMVGQMSAFIRAVRKPDPYKGKGIKYVGEVLKLKPGKQAAKAA